MNETSTFARTVRRRSDVDDTADTVATTEELRISITDRPPAEVEKQQVTESENRTVHVCQVPCDFENLLEMLLENRKRGGGTIESFSVDSETRLAQVVFQNAQGLFELLLRALSTGSSALIVG